LSLFRESLGSSFGEAGLGTALASVQVKHFHPRTGLALVRCGREECAAVWASISFCTAVRARKVAFSVVHESGTLDACVRAAKTRTEAALRAGAGLRCPGGVEAAVAAAHAALDALEP